LKLTQNKQENSDGSHQFHLFLEKNGDTCHQVAKKHREGKNKIGMQDLFEISHAVSKNGTNGGSHRI
jgi:hypothetical protein